VAAIQDSLKAHAYLSNARLVVGCVFLIGGWRREHIPFSRLATATSVTQLAIAVLGLLIPAAFMLSGGADARPATVTHLSLAVAVVLVTCYVVAPVLHPAHAPPSLCRGHGKRRGGAGARLGLAAGHRRLAGQHPGHRRAGGGVGA
jgi:hypothetical protein